jgi:hypothetical protein
MDNQASILTSILALLLILELIAATVKHAVLTAGDETLAKLRCELFDPFSQKHRR